jgi:hypothetical protein
MADFHPDLNNPRTQEAVRISIHTSQAIPLHAEMMLHLPMADETLVITLILETVLHPMEETEIEGLVAGVQIASVARDCKIESVSSTTAAVERNHHSKREIRSVCQADLRYCSRMSRAAYRSLTITQILSTGIYSYQRPRIELRAGMAFKPLQIHDIDII